MSPGGGNPRRVRVAQAMREVLADMLAREVKDPRVHEAGLVCVNHVELNSDMSVAQVYVSFLGVEDRGAGQERRAMAALGTAAGFLRGPVARRLKLRRAPELRFVHDQSAAFQQRISEIVRADEHTAPSRPEGDKERGDE